MLYRKQFSHKCQEIEGDGHIATGQLSDDTACYRISGWALKSAIDRRQKDIKCGSGSRKKELIQKDVQLLMTLRRPKESKIELPVGAQFIDRGGLTYLHSNLLPWVRKMEESMKQFLNEGGYRKYGKNIFKVRTAYSVNC